MTGSEWGASLGMCSLRTGNKLPPAMVVVLAPRRIATYPPFQPTAVCCLGIYHVPPGGTNRSPSTHELHASRVPDRALLGYHVAQWLVRCYDTRMSIGRTDYQGPNIVLCNLLCCCCTRGEGQPFVGSGWSVLR